jgi:hypothetical protein
LPEQPHPQEQRTNVCMLSRGVMHK